MQGGGGFSTAPPPSFLPDIPGRGGRQREYLKRVSSASSSPVPFPYIPLGSLLPPTPPTTQYSLLPLLHHFTSKMAPFRSRMRRTDAALPRRTREGGREGANLSTAADSMWVGGMMGEKRDTSCSLAPPPDLYRPRGRRGRKSIIIPPPPLFRSLAAH